MTLTELYSRLDAEMPEWRQSYDCDPVEAALDLFIIDALEAEEMTTYRPLTGWGDE